MDQRRSTGQSAEDICAARLEARGWRILARNWRIKAGEIDLIAQNRTALVFVEVKLRASDRFAEAKEFVDARKQERLRSTALLYLAEHESALQPRFDVIEIYAPDGVDTIKPDIRHWENAFTLD